MTNKTSSMYIVDHIDMLTVLNDETCSLQLYFVLAQCNLNWRISF